MLNINNLSKSYGTKAVLSGVSLHFEAGKVCGIIGENGAGKTTLFRCIAGLEDYTGDITPDIKPLKEHLGFLMTEPYFLPKITGAEYIRLLCNARGIHIENITEKNIFDLPLTQYVSTYSTGEKKKLALLGILLQENQCFILDEPFNGVDIHSNIIITDVIRTLKTIKKTVIIASHILPTLSETCDEIYLLHNGVIAKKVSCEQFDMLETEMREFSVGNKIERLGLK